MEFLWVWVLVLATPFGIVYVLVLSKWRFPKKITITAAALCIAAVTVMNYFTIRDMSWMVAEQPFLDLCSRMVNICIEAAFAFSFAKQSKAQTVFIILAMCSCVYIVDAIAITMDLWIGSDLAAFLFKLVLYLCVAVMLYRLRKTFWNIALYMKNRLWMICIVQTVLFICGTMMVSFPIPLNLAPHNIPYALMMCLVIVSVYGVFFYVFKLMRRQSILENNTEAFHIYTASLEQQNELINKNAEKAAMFRHDIRHVTQMLDACAENGDMSGVKDLIRLLDNNVSANVGLIAVPVTGHKLLDTVINSYISLANESGINIAVNITGIDSVSADMTELAVVLANALENAVCACKKQGSGEIRAIRMNGLKKGRQYFFEIANTYSGEILFDSATRLPISNEAGHGTGVKSIAYFAEKSGAELQYRIESGWLHMRILL